MSVCVGSCSLFLCVLNLIWGHCFCECSDYFPILICFTTNYLCNYRTTSKHPGNITDPEVYRSSQLSPALTVSSNFEVASTTFYFSDILFYVYPHTIWMFGVHIEYRNAFTVCIDLAVLTCLVSNFIFPG